MLLQGVEYWEYSGRRNNTTINCDGLFLTNFCISASANFDGPVSTNAALAALAAEAGLIDPEPDKESKSVLDSDGSEGQTASSEEMAMDTPVVESVTPLEAATGLFGGSTFQKLGLKGGGRRILPPTRPVTFRGGLKGGSKDAVETPNAKPTTAEADSTQTAVNGAVKHELGQENNVENNQMDIDNLDVKPENTETDIKDEPMEETEPKTEAEPEAEAPANAISQPAADVTKQETTPEPTPMEDSTKKEDAEDPLAALASAALDHSKDLKKTEINNGPAEPAPAKETWYTVGFIKGTSCDVQSYFLLDDETTADLTIDSLPELSNYTRINLEPGTAYKFRVAAINSVGRGDWSEVCTFVIIY